MYSIETFKYTKHLPKSMDKKKRKETYTTLTIKRVTQAKLEKLKLKELKRTGNLKHLTVLIDELVDKALSPS